MRTEVKNFFHWTGLFESNLSAADWAWRLVTLMVVAGGGTTAGLLARGSELFRAAGPLSWFVIGIIGAVLVALIAFLVNLARRQSAEAAYLQVMSQPRGRVNPLSESFVDQVIYLPDLYLPRRQVHSNKQFKRCKLVGPGAIAMLGGTYIRTNFVEAGSPIVLPDNTILSGVLVLENCTVEDCEFVGITLLINRIAGDEFKKMGAPVVGM
jgi:hypothetical protein